MEHFLEGVAPLRLVYWTIRATNVVLASTKALWSMYFLQRNIFHYGTCHHEMIESKVNFSFQAISNSIISHHYGFKSCIQYKILVSSVDISLINPNLKSIVKLPAVDNPRLIQCLKVSYPLTFKNLIFWNYRLWFFEHTTNNFF